MPELDPELLERAIRWCADAGRQVGTAEVRRALAPLGWDELLAVRALLADPPPARPLGPHALADLARGAPADVAAEREREGRYRGEAGPADAPEEPLDEAAPAPPRPAPPRPRRRRSRGLGLVIRRARDRAEPAAPSPAPLPPLDELRRPEGRAVLERLVRRHGARRAPIVAALAAGWSGPGAAAPGDAELSALLDHHGLARAFARREKDELLHAVRAAGGVRGAAADRLGLDAAGLAAALDRLGATADAERIREDRRAELRGRATLAERVRLLLSDEPRLRDLELLDEFERDLRARLPEHVRALRSGPDPVAVALGRSLSVSRGDAEALAARLGVDLGPAEAPRARPRPGAGPRTGPRRPAGGRGKGGPGERRGPRPPGPRALGGRPPGPRASGPRPSGPRASGPRPSGPRASSPRPSGPRASRPGTNGPRPSGARPSGPRPSGGRRPPPRPTGGPRGPGRGGPRGGGAG